MRHSSLARELSHPFSLAYVLLWTALLYNHRREVQETQEWADAVTALSTEREFPYWSTQGTILQGWALAAQGQGAEGMAQIRKGLVALRATGTELLRPYSLGLLADAYGKMGQVREGLALLDEATGAGEQNWGALAGGGSCIGSRGSCCCCCLPTTTRRLKRVFTRPSMWPGASTRSP